MVGELDDNVDPASTMQVVNALEKANKDFDLVVITGSDHGSAETPMAAGGGWISSCRTCRARSPVGPNEHGGKA